MQPRHLVYLPGLDGTVPLRAPFVERARAHFHHVTCVGYPRDRVMDYDALATFARDALPKNAPFVLLGESFSGPVALRIAANAPANLAGLVLSTTFARRPHALLRSQLAPLTRFAPVHAMPVALLIPFLLGAWRTDAMQRALESALASIDAEVLRARMRCVLEEDGTFGPIEAPTLILRATRDWIVSRSAGEALRAAIPQAIVVDLEGPHLLLQANPDEALEQILAFATA